MQLNATYTFDTPIDKTWELLMNTEAIGSCLPGCRGLQPVGDDTYSVELGVAVAAISGDFKGSVSLRDKNPPTSYRLIVDGSGRQGFIKGQAEMTLVPDGERTIVRIAADADVGGMIARVGQRLLEGVARTMMDRFYGCLVARAASGG
jgi:carbon monoxide dehydrogenase subunit G